MTASGNDDSVSRHTIAQTDHNVSSELISENALKVLRRINEAGYEAFMVGGGVRDILTGLTPKDFDVATDATPEQVRGLFRNSRIIGRRFRLVHVVFGREVIEVATFRAAHTEGAGGEIGESGRILRDNVYGAIEDDALRRDFTVNALYYNIADHTVSDFVGGIQDIENRTFRLIGDPEIRCEEDPVRIIRAARLAAKLDFNIAEDTRAAMQTCAPLLSGVPPARMFEELLKLFQGGYAVKSFDNLIQFDLLKYLLPALAQHLTEEKGSSVKAFVKNGLGNTDLRIHENKPVTPAYLLAFLLWHEVYPNAKARFGQGAPAIEAILRAADDAMPEQLNVTSIPKRYSGPMREIWSFQPRLEQYRGKRALSLMESRRFRAAYDFLCLRATTDDNLEDCAQWWTEVQEIPEGDRAEFLLEKVPVDQDWRSHARPKKKSNSNRSRRPRKRKRSHG